MYGVSFGNSNIDNSSFSKFILSVCIISLFLLFSLSAGLGPLT
jgi:hypothetical protein